MSKKNLKQDFGPDAIMAELTNPIFSDYENDVINEMIEDISATIKIGLNPEIGFVEINLLTLPLDRMRGIVLPANVYRRQLCIKNVINFYREIGWRVQRAGGITREERWNFSVK